MKPLFLLFLLGTFPFFAYGQAKELNLEATKPEVQLPIEEASPIEEIKPVEGVKSIVMANETALLNQELRSDVEALKRTLKKDVTIEVVDLSLERRVLEESGIVVAPPESVEGMMKVVLGDVYAEVGHIPEPQWFEMEPIAEEYVHALFEARTTVDNETAMQIERQARTKFEVAIDAKLTAQQKATREQKRAETAAWAQEKANISAQARELIKKASIQTANKTNSQKVTRITFQ